MNLCGEERLLDGVPLKIISLSFKMKCSSRDSNMILQNIEPFNLFDSGDNLLFMGTIEL